MPVIKCGPVGVWQRKCRDSVDATGWIDEVDYDLDQQECRITRFGTISFRINYAENEKGQS